MKSEVGRFSIAAVLLLGLGAISLGSILAKLSQQAPPLSVAFFRMFWASLILCPFYILRRDRRPSGPGEAGSAWWIAAGLTLAMHFAFWIASLYYTTVAVSVLLVSTSPVAAALFARFLLRESINRAGAVGIATALAGALLLLWSDLTHLGDWRGPVLALAGSVSFGLYLVVGRRIRRSSGLLSYVYPTYLLATVLLGSFVLISRSPVTGFSQSTWSCLILLGLVPQCIGHTSYNWALGFLPATAVSTLVLAEPLTASWLAYLLLGESVGPTVFAGGGLVVVGILLVTLRGVVQSDS